MTKERLGTNDNVSVTVIRNKGGKVERHETLEIRGFLDVKLIKPSGLVKSVYRGPNSVDVGIKQYFRSRLEEITMDRSLDSLFTDDEIAPGSTQDGNDGIVCYDANNDTWLSTITTSVTESNDFGAKWKGEITFNNSVDRTIEQAKLGWNYGQYALGEIISAGYAEQDFSSNPVFVQQSDQMVFNWEIYV